MSFIVYERARERKSNGGKRGRDREKVKEGGERDKEREKEGGRGREVWLCFFIVFGF